MLTKATSFAMSTLLLLVITEATPTQTWNATCPSVCKCTACKSTLYGGWLNTVDCSNKKLTHCPLDLPEDTEALLLRGNAIESLDMTQFPSLPILRQLDLSYNRITHLTDPSLISLQHLNLEGNAIETLPSRGLSSLVDLKTLSLANNNIISLLGDSLRRLSRLRHLSLSRNKLRLLNATWWQHTENLDTLQLADNQISSIHDNTFTSLKRLTELSLANNEIKSLQKYSFSGLDKLQRLILDGNGLEKIPRSAFIVLANLKLLSLSGNPIEKIGYHDLYKLPMNEIRLCSMPVLKIIDPGAFYDLPNLMVLQMYDNHKLAYLAHDAFIQIPNLRKLYLHNNKLMTLSADLQHVSPNLHLVSFYGNPIRCDCNIVWIIRLTPNVSYTMELIFDEPDRMICDKPIKWHGIRLHEVPTGEIAQMCPPTVIPFFYESYNLELGATATFECRAIGTNSDRISWILANGKPLNSTANNSRVKFDPIGKLIIKYVKVIDAGTYTCVATGDTGFDTMSSVLRIHSKNARVLPQRVATDFVSVTWNGMSDTIFSADYTILHRRKGSGAPYRQIHINMHARSLTIPHLRPETTYEFCMAYGSNQTKLNCVDIRTLNEKFNELGITTFDPIKPLVVFISICVVFVFIRIISTMVKRYRQQQAYKDPTTVAGNYNTMSNISLDDLYHPPNTPLTTSKTCLVNNNKT